MARFRDILVAWGPLGVFLLAIVESTGLPNPGGTDAIVVLAAIANPRTAMLSGALAALGSLIGSLVFYEITRRGGEKLLTKYTSSPRGQKFRAWFLQYGLVTVFITALVPIPILPYKVFAASAGAMAVPRRRLFPVLAAARFPRYLGMAYLGARLGENSSIWLRSHLWHLLGVAFAIALLSWALIRISDSRRIAAQGSAPLQ